MNERGCTGVLLNGQKLGFVQRAEVGPLCMRGDRPDITLTFVKFREETDQTIVDVMESEISALEAGSEETIRLLSRSAPWVKIQREYPLISFFKGYRESVNGSLWSILRWEDEALERVHNWIQWVFPNREPSAFSDAPLLNDEVIQELRRLEYQTVILAAYARFCGFLHLNDETPHWMAPGNHNFLRITRVLKFLTELGLQNLADALHAEVLKACERNPGIVNTVTLNYWLRALSP